MSVICPSCNTPATPGAIFCDNCGFDLRKAPPAAPPAPATPMGPSIAGEKRCANCGQVNVPDAMFCENCGARLAEASPPPIPPAPQYTPPPPPLPQYAPPPQPPVPPTPPPYPSAPAQPPAAPPTAAIEGKFVILSSNTTVPFPSGKTELIIGREDPVSNIFPDIDLEPFGGLNDGVGRRHARLFILGGKLMVEDLNSVNGTFLNRQKIAPSQSMPLNHGDELRLGKMVLQYFSS